MTKLGYAMAMIVAGGVMGSASQAAAAVYVETFNYAGPTDGTDFSYDITLAGALDPQFRYEGGAESTGLPGTGFSSVKHHLTALGSSGINSISYGDPSLPAPGETFTSTSVKTYDTSFVTARDQYFHLTFDANGQTYLGTAKVTVDHTLESITYTEAAVVPEPEAWALLILGAGVAGAALRRQRQRQLVTAR